MAQSSARLWRRRLGAGLAACALLAAACGDSDEGATPATEGSTDTTAAAGGGTDTTAAAGEGADTTAAGGAAAGEGFAVEGEVIIDQETFDAAVEEGQVVVYTTNTDQGATALAEAFEEDTGIAVEYFRGPGSEMTQRILAETGGGVNAFDIVVLTSPGDMGALQDEGLLASYEMPQVEEFIVAPEEIDADRQYYPLLAWLYIIAVNRGAVGDDVVVETWEDVLQPEFQGTLGITPAGVGGTGVAQAAFQREVLGEDYWTALGEVDPVIFSTTATVAEALTRGEITAGILAESVIAPAIAQGAPVELVYPEEGVIGGVSYQAVAEEAPHPNAARVYQAWSLAKRGQDVVALDAGARPVRTDAADANFPGADLPGQSEINIWWSNLQERMADREELVSAWNQAVGYTE